MSPRMKRSQPPLSTNSSTGLLLRYSNTESMLAMPSLTPLAGNLESMTSKPEVGGGSKNCRMENLESRTFFVHADKVTTDSSTD